MPNKNTYNLIQEPEGATYRALLDVGSAFCDAALLVVREKSAISASALEIMGRLRPSLIREEHVSEWPGTILYGHTALVMHYALQSCLEGLKSAVPGLFAWLHPDRPEDLCLMRSDGTPWLVTISHEQDGYFELKASEHAELIDRLPELDSMLQRAEQEP